jgi:hypothetical protein
VELAVADGVAFLHSFEEPIDLLYLDFWTPDPDGALSGTGRAHAYRDAYAAARERLNRRSMILIDDTYHSTRGSIRTSLRMLVRTASR